MNIGIDLGGTNIVAGLMTPEGRLICKESVKTLPERGFRAVAEDISALCRKVCESGGCAPEEAAFIGIGSPGSLDRENGVIIFAANLGFEGVPLRALLQEDWPNAVIALENDANAAALGEYAAGAARGYGHSITVTLGTGVGGGIILDGKVYSGYNGTAGEVGHHVIVSGGIPCTCGRNGCWESYASATGLIRLTKEAMGREPDSLMHSIAERQGKVSGRTAFDAMRAGDAAGKAVTDEYLGYVAEGLSNLINILQPEVVCIGGGIAGEGESLLDALRPLVDKGVFKCDGRKTRLVLAELGNDAGVIGAAMLGA